MQPQADIEIELFIRATVERIWEALTDPKEVEKHHFNNARVSGLEEGGYALLDKDGRPFIKQELVRAEVHQRLEMNFEPAWTSVEAPASRVVFEISQEAEGCKLRLEHFHCADIGIGDNWHRFTSGLKSYLETGERFPLPRPN